MNRVKVEDLQVRVKELNAKEMQKVFGGAVYSTFNSTFSYKALEPGCALCLGGIVQRPEGGGEWLSGSTLSY